MVYYVFRPYAIIKHHFLSTTTYFNQRLCNGTRHTLTSRYKLLNEGQVVGERGVSGLKLIQDIMISSAFLILSFISSSKPGKS